MATPTFSYNYNPLQYADAQKQIAGQIDPLYNRAIQNVQTQKYQNDVQAGQVAASRGLGRSGLAADQLNKLAIAAQGQIGDISAQRATQIAQLANDLMERDKDRGMQSRSQAYQEWMGQQNLERDDRDYNYQRGRDKVSDQRYMNEWNYQVGRDKVSDSRYNKEWDYQMGRDKVSDQRYNTEWNYQVGRDKVSDQRYNTEWNYQVGQDKLAEAWKQREWNSLSPAERARAELDFQYAKKKATLSSGGSGGSSSRRSSGSSSSSTASKKASSNLSTQYKQYQNTKSASNKSALDKYYENQTMKTPNKQLQKIFEPVPPAKNKNLTSWEKMRMFGM